MSDVPIVANKNIESSREFFDPSPEIFKFMIATHMVPITISKQVYNDALDYVQERISLLTNNSTFQNELGKGGILDMNIHGKPLSLLHIALSKGRSNVQQELNEDTVKKAMRLFEKNMSDTLAKWSLTFPEQGKQDLSWAAFEQKLMIGYIRENGPSKPEQVFGALCNEMSRDTFVRMWKELYDKGAIYEKETDTFAVAPFVRE